MVFLRRWHVRGDLGGLDGAQERVGLHVPGNAQADAVDVGRPHPGAPGQPDGRAPSLPEGGERMKFFLYLLMQVGFFLAFVMNIVMMFDADPIRALSGKVGMFGFLLLMHVVKPPELERK